MKIYSYIFTILLSILICQNVNAANGQTVFDATNHTTTQTKFNITEVSNSHQPSEKQLKSSIKKNVIKDKTFINRTWKAIKGNPSPNSLMIGMFSYHTSNKDYQETNNLLGIDYKGLSISTFTNSYDNQSVLIGVARDVYTTRIEKINTDFRFGYKAGLLYGYKDKYPNLAGFSPVPLPVCSFDFKYIGMDIWPIPGKHPTVAMSFRLKLEDILNTIKH